MSDQIMRGLVYGKGAHADPLACVDDISAAIAARRISGSPHSIWQIVSHLNYWMDYDLRTIAGENPPYPQHAIESWPEHPDAANQSADVERQWQRAVQQFRELLTRIVTLSESDSATLELLVAKAEPADRQRQCTVHTALWEIVVHNSYHLGQIALLRRQAGAWPPQRGSDTW